MFTMQYLVKQRGRSYMTRGHKSYIHRGWVTQTGFGTSTNNFLSTAVLPFFIPDDEQSPQAVLFEDLGYINMRLADVLC